MARDTDTVDETVAPDQPTDLPKHSWPQVLKRTFKQFSEDKLTTWAAALTYYAILSIFPALLALMSILGLIGQSATQPLIDNLGAVAPGPAKDIVTGVLGDLQANSGASGLAFVIGLAVAIWSASGYINGFMEASNSVWDVPEGRPIWKRIPLRIGLTVLMLVLLAASALMVVLHRAGRPEGRRPHRPRRHVHRRVGDREVAGARAARVLHDLAALLAWRRTSSSPGSHG